MKKLLAALLLAAAPAAAQTVDLCAVTNAASAELTDEVLVCRPGTPNASRLVSIEEILDLVPAGIGGSVGSTDNRVPRSDGTGGATVQSSAVEINDAGQLLVFQTTFLTPSLSGQGDANTGFHIGRAADLIEVVNGGLRTWYWEAAGALGVNNTATGAYMVADNGHNNATPAYGFRNDLNTGLRPASSGDTGSAVIVCNGAPCATFAPGAVTFNAAQFVTTPQATAPATCTVGAFYTDNSGGLALCACTATNTWTLWLPAVVTTENCT